jgi:hypothetical protein
MENNVLALGMSSSKYAQEAMRNIELNLAENFGGHHFMQCARGPWPTNYVSELNTMPKLSPKLATYYQLQIGVLHWIVDGSTSLQSSLLASAMAMPREGHLDVVFHVFVYLKGKHNACQVFDLTYPEIDEASFLEHDWKNTYGNVQEAVPPEMPQS